VLLSGERPGSNGNLCWSKTISLWFGMSRLQRDIEIAGLHVDQAMKPGKKQSPVYTDQSEDTEN